MRRYRNWVLTLGIMAATPGVTLAAPLSFLNNNAEGSPAASQTDGQTERSNQAVAEDIAQALRSAKLNGYDIEIEYQDGVAVLSGRIANAQQKAAAASLASQISGVDRVENRLETLQRGSNGIPGRRASYNRTAPQQPSDSSGQNQQMAEKIAGALSKASLNGYDIEVRYKNGLVLLSGTVGNRGEWYKAGQIVSRLPGVRGVNNQLTIEGESPYGPIRQTAYQPPAGGPNGMPGPAPVGPPGAGGSQVAYNMPNLPDHAWPATAAYPNYSQVSYPEQYSASAWPYIGPFYPYPQVPLGWREAQLEWDDGYWHLNFRPRTSRWWWFMNPENW